MRNRKTGNSIFQVISLVLVLTVVQLEVVHAQSTSLNEDLFGGYAPCLSASYDTSVIRGGKIVIDVAVDEITKQRWYDYNAFKNSMQKFLEVAYPAHKQEIDKWWKNFANHGSDYQFCVRARRRVMYDTSKTGFLFMRYTLCITYFPDRGIARIEISDVIMTDLNGTEIPLYDWFGEHKYKFTGRSREEWMDFFMRYFYRAAPWHFTKLFSVSCWEQWRKDALNSMKR